MIKFLNHAADRLTKAQARALTTLLHYAVERRGHQAAGHEIVYDIEVSPTDYRTAWVSIKPDIPSLGENNLLRLLRNCEKLDSWHVHIGKRGKLEAFQYPKSIEQFAGQQWCFIHIKDHT